MNQWITKKNKIIFGIGMLLLLPVLTVVGLSDQAQKEKDALEQEFYELKPEVMEILDDTNKFLIACDDEISDQLTFGMANAIYSKVRDQNLSGLMEILTTEIEFSEECQADAEALRDRATDNVDEFLEHARAWRNFLQDEVRNLGYSDVYPLVDDNLDVAIEMFRVLDNFVNILDESMLASDDYEAIILEEFPEQVDQIFAYRDTALALANDKLENRVMAILTDESRTDSEKIAAIMNRLAIAADIRDDIVAFHSELQGELTNNQLQTFVAREKAEGLDEFDQAMAYAKKLLINEMGRATLDSELGADETDDLIEAVYGVSLEPNVYGVIDGERNFHVYNMNNKQALIESIIEQQHGEVEFVGLVDNKVATGSTLVVKDGDEVLLEYTFVVKGDLLGRGMTDISDLIALIDHVFDHEKLAGEFAKAADINDNNTHDITDVVKLIDLILTGSV